MSTPKTIVLCLTVMEKKENNLLCMQASRKLFYVWEHIHVWVKCACQYTLLLEDYADVPGNLVPGSRAFWRSAVTGPDGSWRVLTGPEGSWRVLTCQTLITRLLLIGSCSNLAWIYLRWLLMDPDWSWWVLMGPDGSWWVLMGPERSWRVLLLQMITTLLYLTIKIFILITMIIGLLDFVYNL